LQNGAADHYRHRPPPEIGNPGAEGSATGARRKTDVLRGKPQTYPPPELLATADEVIE
jgi:hypothetical protein